MKDIQKMKADFAEEIRLAEIANEFESRFGISVHVFRANGYDMAHIECDNTMAKRLLNELEADADWAIDHETNSKNVFKYRLTSVIRYLDTYSKLEIEFFHKGMLYWIDLKINDNELLQPFFKTAYRTITDTELSTWHPVTYTGALDRNKQIPQMQFKSSLVKRYYGGDQLLIDEAEIERIINTIKNYNHD